MMLHGVKEQRDVDGGGRSVHVGMHWKVVPGMKKGTI